jgi:hypothetical protein
VKPVPPRIKIRKGLAAWPVDPTLLLLVFEKADAPGTNPKPTLPPAMAESLRKVLLVVDIYFSPEEFDLIPKETRALAILFCNW